MQVWKRAHPRSRGEHYGVPSARQEEWGSSPLARGTPADQVGLRRREGLIPARAGNTPLPLKRRISRTAHPRSRGEHWWWIFCGMSRWGSSPLARGTRPGELGTAARNGLIPARAGNTDRTHHQYGGIWAHPRSRGEHGVTCCTPGGHLGSSPLARGTPFASKQGMQANGLIPARAGNTGLR